MTAAAPIAPDVQHTLLRSLVRPLARWCVRHGVKLQELIGIVKEELVRAAQESAASPATSIALDDAPKNASKNAPRKIEPSTSQISAMTGVHRKDVAALVQNQAGALVRTGSLYSKVIGAWQQNKKFSLRGGGARVLSHEGKESEFAQLVQSVSVDLNPYTVLAELERLGLVTRGTRGLKLLVRGYQPRKDLIGSYELLGGDINDLVSAVDANLEAQGGPVEHHAKTEYDNVPPEAVATIRDWLFREGAAFHARARNFIGSFDRDVAGGVSQKGEQGSNVRMRIAIGSFSRISEVKAPNTFE